ncbi:MULTISPECIES: Sec-independent protein translocase protein TatB [Pseudofrankia]|uniref:Sec-independent protein translocase protein TatB n=1 Tax=Pseudofrankia TaxID=2994363 RepID=UPI000234B2E5|nr:MULTISPECIES: Sec-independent protein translocase protein TatB [Pseudofrankia]OHV37888.1 preprotein translocase subunit TatB [Pseudofrankia sp. EUN1h]
MFNGLGWGEIAVLLLLGLFVFGPDKLPRVARDAGRMLRQLRQMANGVRDDLRSELGPEIADLDIRDLHPKTFVRKHLLEDGDEDLFPTYRNKQGKIDLFGDEPSEKPSLTKDRVPGGAPAAPGKPAKPVDAKATRVQTSADAVTPWDTDAT